MKEEEKGKIYKEMVGGNTMTPAPPGGGRVTDC
jgi:hypothetical protein